MIRLIWITILISANCINVICDEETSTTVAASELSEKPELLSANPESSRNEAKNVETENQESKTYEDGEEIRVYRSSSNRSAKIETQFDDSAKADSIEDSLTEKSASSELNPELNRQADKEANESESKADIPETSQDETKSEKHGEEQSQESPEISRLIPETEERKTEDISEASAESKVSDNEKISSKVDEIDRNSDSVEIKEKSNESGLNESSGTRRMLSGPDNIVIDTEARSDTTSNPIEPEMKTALNKNLNPYNSLNEFGSNSNTNLIDSSRTDPASITGKSAIPVIINAASPEIFNQQYIPKFYPRPELNINFPNVNSDFQGPRDLPIYLKIKQDDIQSENQFLGALNQHFKSEENKYVYPRNQRQYPQSQVLLGTPGILANKQLKDTRTDTKNEKPRSYGNKAQTDFENFMRNRQIPNLNQDARNQLQLYQNKNGMNSYYKQNVNSDRESRTQVQELVNSKMPIYNEQRNQYPLFRQPEGMPNSEISLDNRQFENERYTKPYPYLHPPDPQQIHSLNYPIRYNDNIIPKQIQFLFQKLAGASHLPTFLHNNNNNIQHYPFFINGNLRAGSSFYPSGLSAAKLIGVQL